MKKTIIRVICLIISTVIIGCNKTKKNEERKSLVVVLCDASNSTTLINSEKSSIGRLEKLKYYVKKIPKWYPFRSELYFYPISDNILSENIGGVVSYNVLKTSQLLNEKTRVDSLTTVISSEMDELATKTKNSCILLSIQRAITVLNEKNNDDFDNELIIISDMLECCKGAENSDINLNVFDTNKLNEQIELFRKNNTSMNVESLNLKITVIINSPGMSSRYEKIREIWEKWFIKIGVKKDKISFNTSEPDTEENHLLNKF